MNSNESPKPRPGNIYAAITLIMSDMEHVGKDRKNVQQGYAFRGIDDVYAALQKLMAKYGVFSVPTVLEDHTEERTTKNGGALIYRVLKIKYTFYAADGSHVDAVVIGEGMDSGDKATNKAMSVAQKYAYIQVFSIPTKEAKDPEVDHHEDIIPNQNRVAPKTTLDQTEEQARQRFVAQGKPIPPPPPDQPLVNELPQPASSMSERILLMLEKFGKVGVDADMIHSFLKKPVHEALDYDIKTLQEVYKKIAKGARASEFFKTPNHW